MSALKPVKNFFFRSFKFEFFIGLCNLQLSYVYDTFVSINFLLILILFIYFSLYFFICYKSYTIFVETNKEDLTLLCKRLQKFFNENQTFLFILVNFIVFLLISFCFDPIFCLIIHVLWLDVYLFFYLMYIFKFPVVHLVLMISIFGRLFVAGFFSKILVCAALLGYFVFSCMDLLGVFNFIKTYIKIIQDDQIKLLNHKKTEFLFFYVLEQQYIVLLIISVLVPGIFMELGLNFDLNLNEQDFIFHLNLYTYSFIMVITVINLIVIWFFNPGPMLKTAAACFGCIGGAAAVGAAYVQHQDSVWDRATGGIREPGPSDSVASAQISVFKARITTAEGIRQAKVYREIFPHPLPTHPGTDVVNNYEVSRALVEDTTPLQKQRVNLMLGRNESGLPYPKENPVKSLASKTGKGF